MEIQRNLPQLFKGFPLDEIVYTVYIDPIYNMYIYVYHMYLMGGKPGGVGLTVLAGQLVSCPPSHLPQNQKNKKHTKKQKKHS